MANYEGPTNVKLRQDPDVPGNVLLTFDWPAKWGNYTREYNVWWFYTTENGNQFSADKETWDPVWGDPSAKRKSWTYPATAVRVEARVNAFPTDDYKFLPKFAIATFDVKANAFPTIPSTPSVSITQTGALKIDLENINIDTSSIEFQIWQEDANKVYGTAKVTVSGTRAVSYTKDLKSGHTYKVRARAFKASGLSSSWSDFSSLVNARPTTPVLNTARAYLATGQVNPTSFYVSWTKNDSIADHFTIEYTDDILNFTNEIEANIQTQDTADALTTNDIVTGLEAGHTYYVRIKSVNDSGSSAASNILSVIIGSKPSPPTTWSRNTTMRVGDTNDLYWAHNATDGSSQVTAKVKMVLNDTYTETITLTNTTNPEHIDDTSRLTINTANGTYTWFNTTYNFSVLTASIFALGGSLKWAVSTSGVTQEYGDESVQRQIDIFAKPNYTFVCSSLEASTGIPSYRLPSYPIDLTATTIVTDTQEPLSYHVQIVANESYRIVDVTGKYRYISEGEVVFERFYDESGTKTRNSNSWTYTKDVSLSAGDVDLESGITYTVTMEVALSSALTESDSIDFIVEWEDSIYSISADFLADSDQLTIAIQPYCMAPVEDEYVAVDTSDPELADRKPAWVGWYELRNGSYVLSEDLSIVSGKTYYEQASALTDDALLSVYRRNYDNTFSLIADNIANTRRTSVVDPHPQLNGASYRIVAMSQTNGGISWGDFYDIELDEKSIVLQWDESWSNYYEDEDASSIEYPYAGSMLKLPWNIDISSSNAPDVASVEYIGRQHPVSYYGTQLGETASWSTDVDKSDTDTLAKIRELMTYMGDVYVREPSGIGFWANVKLSYNMNHTELVVPVSIEITRVEGGI